MLIMKNIILLNGSPRVNKSTSMKILSLLKNRLGADFKASVVEAGKSILRKKQSQDYALMAKADAIVIAFPLYVYCMPGALTEFLVGYREYVNGTGKPAKQKIYAIINCGFPESRINAEAALVIKRFCKEIHASYRLSVLIGSGGMLQPLKMMPSVKKMWRGISTAFDQIISDIQDGGTPVDINIDAKMTKKLFFFIGQTNFAVIAKKNGIKKKELLRKPYREEKIVC